MRMSALARLRSALQACARVCAHSVIRQTKSTMSALAALPSRLLNWTALLAGMPLTTTCHNLLIATPIANTHLLPAIASYRMQCRTYHNTPPTALPAHRQCAHITPPHRPQLFLPKESFDCQQHYHKSKRVPI